VASLLSGNTNAAFGSHSIYGRLQRAEFGGTEVAKIGDCFRCALGRDDEFLSAVGHLLHMRHGYLRCRIVNLAKRHAETQRATAMFRIY
jgi:hypothetical protein